MAAAAEGAAQGVVVLDQGLEEEGVAAVEYAQVQLIGLHRTLQEAVVAGLGPEGAGQGVTVLLELRDAGVEAFVLGPEIDGPGAGNVHHRLLAQGREAVPLPEVGLEGDAVVIAVGDDPDAFDHVLLVVGLDVGAVDGKVDVEGVAADGLVAARPDVLRGHRDHLLAVVNFHAEGRVRLVDHLEIEGQDALRHLVERQVGFLLDRRPLGVGHDGVILQFQHGAVRPRRQGRVAVLHEGAGGQKRQQQAGK